MVIYNDLEHYAKATAREQASEEWGEFNSRFPAGKFSTSFVGLSNTLVGAGQEPAKGGEALQIFLFNAAGGVTELASLVEQGAAIQAKVVPKASVRFGVPQVAGPNVGTAAVLVRYPSLVDWAQGDAKLQASEEWGEFLASFPIDRFPIVYTGLSRAVSLD